MIDSIIGAVGKALSEKFENIKIYNEIIKQGFKTPCFCISALSVCDSLFRGRRYNYKGNIEVRYYTDTKMDSAKVIERLFACLECIEVDKIGLLRGNDMKCKVCDDYYSFEVGYEFFYIKEPERDLMGNVNLKIEL